MTPGRLIGNESTHKEGVVSKSEKVGAELATNDYSGGIKRY